MNLLSIDNNPGYIRSARNYGIAGQLFANIYSIIEKKKVTSIQREQMKDTTTKGTTAKGTTAIFAEGAIPTTTVGFVAEGLMAFRADMPILFASYDDDAGMIVHPITDGFVVDGKLVLCGGVVADAINAHFDKREEVPE